MAELIPSPAHESASNAASESPQNSTTELELAAELTFEEAIALSQILLDHMNRGALPDVAVERQVAALAATENGARGFLVTYLSVEESPADHPSEAVVRGLKSSPAVVSELLVKNLAMSSAMAIAHRRNEDETMAEGSDRVRSRTIQLIQRVQLPEVTQKAQQLHETAATGQGDYKAFLDRWGYDTEQRQVIQNTIEETILSLGN